MDHGDDETEVESDHIQDTGLGGTWMMKTLKRSEMFTLEQWFYIELKRGIWGGRGYQGLGVLQLWKTFKKGR